MEDNSGHDNSNRTTSTAAVTAATATAAKDNQAMTAAVVATRGLASQNMTSDKQEGDDNDENDCGSSSNANSNANFCPLFMDTLPSDFASNPQISAIASLLNDKKDDTTSCSTKMGSDNEIKEAQHKVNATRLMENSRGGGKVRKLKSRRGHAPYPAMLSARRKGLERKSSGEASDGGHESQICTKAAGKAFIGESQLFLKMWKL